LLSKARLTSYCVAVARLPRFTGLSLASATKSAIYVGSNEEEMEYGSIGVMEYCFLHPSLHYSSLATWILMCSATE